MQDRKEKLEELTKLSQELGLYEIDPSEDKRTLNTIWDLVSPLCDQVVRDHYSNEMVIEAVREIVESYKTLNSLLTEQTVEVDFKEEDKDKVSSLEHQNESLRIELDKKNKRIEFLLSVVKEAMNL